MIEGLSNVEQLACGRWVKERELERKRERNSNPFYSQKERERERERRYPFQSFPFRERYIYMEREGERLSIPIRPIALLTFLSRTILHTSPFLPYLVATLSL